MKTKLDFDWWWNLACAFVIGVGIASGCSSDYYRKKAIENDAAHYNQTTGKFEWNKP